jgi:hypothetical protein
MAAAAKERERGVGADGSAGSDKAAAANARLREERGVSPAMAGGAAAGGAAKTEATKADSAGKTAGAGVASRHAKE